MRKYVRFAASFLSVAIATATFAADLRTLDKPAKIMDVFKSAAKVRVVNVWATWCGPCVAEMPDLRAIDEAFGKDVGITGVSMDDMIPDAKSSSVAEFLDKHGIAFPNVYYTGDAVTLARFFEFNGEIPITIVYDHRGNELWRHEGRLDKDQTIARVRELLRRMQ